MRKMAKQSRSKKQEFVGKGKVTPVQIAFIVDRYLSDNSYTHTRTTFRSEASNLIAKSPVQEAPKSLLSLGAILDEYITLKEQKVWVDQERCRLEKEKLRVQNLLSGMQNVMNVYNAGENAVVAPTPPLPLGPLPSTALGAMTSESELAVARPAAAGYMYNTPAMMSSSGPSNIQKDPTNFSTPAPNHAMTKRKDSKNVSHGPAVLKKSRKSTQTGDVNLVTKSSNIETNQDKSLISSVPHPSVRDNAPNGSQAYNVVKCLFNQETHSPPANSSVPKTPTRASLQTEKSSSPIEVCSTATPQQIMSTTNCTIISSETFRVSPNKQISYYSIEKNHISTCSPSKTNKKNSNTKDHVKGRLDFGTSEMPAITENQSPTGNSTSESEEGDVLDFELPNLDDLGLDFNLSEFLIDFNMESEGLGLSSHQVQDSSPDCHSWSPSKSGNVGTGGSRQVTSDFSSNMTGFPGDYDSNFVGADSVTAMRSVTKRITILSPAKRQRSNFGQENVM